MDGPLIVVRAVHFAAAAMTAGILVFSLAVAAPAFRAAGVTAAAFQRQLRRTAWITLAITVISGLVWVLLQASAMSGLPLGEAVTAEVLWSVMSDTDFGIVSDIRFALAALCAPALAYVGSEHWARWLSPASAAGLVATLAWTGHAVGTPEWWGALHLTADSLHLLAAAAWIGGLLPLAMLLVTARRDSGPQWSSIAREATRRFSTLGICSVGTLLATGIVNSWLLVGSFAGLTSTEYGRLLAWKLALFAGMLSIAAVNRLWLTPRLALPHQSQQQRNALHQLACNSIVEIALGLAVFAIVGALGTLHPAIHLLP